MKTTLKTILFFGLTASTLLQVSCNNPKTNTSATESIKPVFVTDAVRYDSDDPAIWVNKTDPSKSLVIATDKDADGALFVYDLQGKIVKDKVASNLKRPNNVDIAYGLIIGGNPSISL
ncbi:phytase [Sphingobacterium sp. E70]|uniref:phytase n=1 Tax=Sphingobacterium sp. E70 TaxID=2853439 RepID=UPI00211B7DBD|nr:phytase [Sphingobacterium sp. E70]ULT24622.1 phytase [Sphingobacterium sp. E70]